MAEPAGEKRKADEAVEDVEETEGQGSPMKARLDDDEDIMRAQGTTPATTIDLLELHSESGVAEEAKTFGMNAVDLREGWGLDKISDRNRLLEYVREKKPAFVIGRPQCNMFSRLQNMNAWAGKRRQQYNEAVEHMKFVFELYQLQVREGRWFIHEHPKESTSWKLKEVSSLRKVEGVFDVETDQCMYGLAARGKR